MNVVYASRMGHVDGIVKRLGITNALKITDGSETVDGDYVLFTYTDGQGMIPEIVGKFLEGNPHIKAVVGSGSMERHAETFNFASKKIAEKYQVPLLATLDLDGSDKDIEELKGKLASYL